MISQTPDVGNALDLSSYFDEGEGRVELPEIRRIEEVARDKYSSIEVVVSYEEPKGTLIFAPKRMMTLDRLKGLVMLSGTRGNPKNGQFYPFLFERVVWRTIFAMAHQKAVKAGMAIKCLHKALIVITVYEHTKQLWDVDNFAISFIHNGLVAAGFLRSDDFKSMRYLIQGAEADPGIGKSYVTIGIYEDENGNKYNHIWEKHIANRALI